MSATINSIATGSQPRPDDPNSPWLIDRQSQIPQDGHPSSLRPGRRHSNTPSVASSDSTNYLDDNKSLSGISLRAFLLGTSIGLTITLAIFLLTLIQTPFWRVPFFIATLSLFHFLEFYVTATYNPRAADVDTFLLSSNGWAYNIAHSAAVVECIVAHYFWPGRSALGEVIAVTEPLYGTSVSPLLLLGLFLVVLGQFVRSFAMAQATSNFNHHVQSEHREGHVLVTHGLYRVLRHPSYFGFFWWGIGTQLVLGNVVCLVGYFLVLWRFFYTRIKREEAFLIRFFGAEYVQYRQVTPVGIPGIR